MRMRVTNKVTSSICNHCIVRCIVSEQKFWISPPKVVEYIRLWPFLPYKSSKPPSKCYPLNLKISESKPHYFSILRGVCFLHIFWKTAVSASKRNFLIKSHLFPLFEVFVKFRVKISIWGTYSNFSEKVKKADPP